jgi:prevent-host-death family protein
MEQIRPITDIKTKLSEIDREVTEVRNPVILTKNGYGHMVVVSYQDYGKLVSRPELYRLLDEGLDDFENGRTQDFHEAVREIREGIAHDRKK